MSSQKQVTFRIDDKFYALLESEASNKGIPINSFARQLLADQLLDQGNDELQIQIQMLREIRALTASTWSFLRLRMNDQDVAKSNQALSLIAKGLQKRVEIFEEGIEDE